jgi:hypothetical protein
MSPILLAVEIVSSYTLHVYSVGCGKGPTLHVHTDVGGKGYALHVSSVGCGKDHTLHVHAAGCGKGYTLHVHTDVGGKGTPCTSILLALERLTPVFQTDGGGRGDTLHVYTYCWMWKWIHPACPYYC